MTDPTASAHAHAHAHVVLDEDVWLAAIEEIVGRDFFPDARAVERPAAIYIIRLGGNIAKLLASALTRATLNPAADALRA